MTAMNFYGDFSKSGFGCNLLIHQPGGNQGHDFPLARTYGFQPRSQIGQLRLAYTPFAVTFDGGCHCIQHILIAKWLGQKVDRTSFHRSDRHGDIAMTSHENYWNIDVGVRQLRLKIQTADSWQPDVQDQAARDIWKRGLKEFRSRGE
jgi:hypothetical protein